MTQITARHAATLEKRGLDLDLLVRHGVESCERAGGEWIMIPFLKAGVVVNRKYRTIEGQKKFSQDAGAAKCFWNYDVITDPTLANEPLIITEGEFDALAAIQAGYPRTVSVPDGAPAEAIANDNDSRKYSYLLDAERDLRDVREIILAVDTDPAGSNLLLDLGLRLGRTRCKWVRYPKAKGDVPACKDLNDALMRHGIAGVKRSIERADWLKIDGFYRMSELPPVEEKVIHEIGFPVLDTHYKIRRGDFCVVTGIPGHGKSTVITDIACRMVVNHRWTVAFASFEQSPQVDHRRNLRTWFNRKKVIWQSDEERARADAWIDRWFSFICPGDEDEVTLEWVLDRASASIVRHGADMLAIDPWNEMDHSRPRDMTLTEYTGFAIKEFKRFARRHNVHLVVAAHPAKMRPIESENGERRYAIPTLYDISDSSHWANKADIGMIVWRGIEKGAQINRIRIGKSRYHDQIGVPGDTDVTFDPNTNRFEATDTEGSRVDEDAA